MFTRFFGMVKALARLISGNVTVYFLISDKPMLKRAMMLALVVLYLIYFGFVMKLKHPFEFPSHMSPTTIYRDHLFRNNSGKYTFDFIFTAEISSILSHKILFQFIILGKRIRSIQLDIDHRHFLVMGHCTFQVFS